MKLHKIAWFEALVGSTIYPVYTDSFKAHFAPLSKRTANGIEIKSIQQAHILHDNQYQWGTRYLREEERTVPA